MLCSHGAQPELRDDEEIFVPAGQPFILFPYLRLYQWELMQVTMQYKSIFLPVGGTILIRTNNNGSGFGWSKSLLIRILSESNFCV
jgi:hypothetical protein